ncbi:MAG: 5-bromo-4-chloroindolyl phosphate hydrolysis family protein [Arenicellales bacterium]
MATPYREKIKKQPLQGPILPYLLPLPIIITLLFSLAHNQFFPFLISLISVGLYLLSGYFISRASFYAKQAQKRKWLRPNRTPWRLSAALFTGIATALIAYFLTQDTYGLFSALGFGVVAFVGMVFSYGLDPKYSTDDINLGGVSSEELTDAFEEAEAKIDSIEASANKTTDAALAARLRHIAQGSRGILDIIEDDPKDLRRARKFLKVYLDGAQQVVHKYVHGEHVQSDEKISANLNEVLNTIDTVIEEQRIKLLENDILSLDVQIEVLQTQLKHEGIT